MDLSYGDNGNGDGGNGDGIYVSKCRIIGVTDTSGVAENGTARDLSLQCTLSVDGLDFQPTFYVSGDFKRDPNTQAVKGIGGAFKVTKFITTVTGLERVELLEANGNRIDPEVLNLLVGKEFLRLSYRSGTKPNGKVKYSVWPIVGAADSDPDDLKRQFIAEKKKTGYPTAYSLVDAA